MKLCFITFKSLRVFISANINFIVAFFLTERTPP